MPFVKHRFSGSKATPHDWAKQVIAFSVTGRPVTLKAMTTVFRRDARAATSFI
jgi:hypothetical protein